MVFRAILRRHEAVKPFLGSAGIVTASGSKPDLLSLIPRQAIDSHMHVFAPSFPPPPLPAGSSPRPYNNPNAPMVDAVKLFGKYLPRMVVVQPSSYGNDNSCQLSGVKFLEDIAPSELKGKMGCAVIEVDPERINTKELQRLHEQGTRGFRINFISRGLSPSPEIIERTLKAYAELAHPLGWALQAYIDMRSLPGLRDVLETNKLDVPIVLDHFAHPTLSTCNLESGPRLPEGAESLIEYLANPKSDLFVKISASFRFLPRMSPSPSAETLAAHESDSKKLLNLFDKLAWSAPNRLVFGSDWPHTRYEKPGEVDTLAELRKVVQWCLDVEGGDEEMAQELIDKIFRDNAERLWWGRQ